MKQVLSIVLYFYYTGGNVHNNADNQPIYHLVNVDERNRIKNNDKSLVALERKDLLYDNANSKEGNEKYSGNIWKYRNKEDYNKKMQLKEKFAKQFYQKNYAANKDKTFGMNIPIFFLSTYVFRHL